MECTFVTIMKFFFIILLAVYCGVRGDQPCPKCDKTKVKKCIGGELIFDEDDGICKLPTEKIRNTRPIPNNGVGTAPARFYVTLLGTREIYKPEFIRTNTTQEWINWCNSKAHPIPLYKFDGTKQSHKIKYQHPTMCFHYISCWSNNGITGADEIGCHWRDGTETNQFDPAYEGTAIVEACRENVHVRSCKSEIPKVWGAGWDKSQPKHPCSQFESLDRITKTVPDPSNCNGYFTCIKNNLGTLYPQVMFVNPNNCSSCTPFDSWHCPEGKMYYDNEKEVCSLWSLLSSKRRTQCALGKFKIHHSEEPRKQVDADSGSSESEEDSSEESSKKDDTDGSSEENDDTDGSSKEDDTDGSSEEDDTDESKDGGSKDKDKKDGSDGKQTKQINYQYIKMGRKMQNKL